MISVYKYYPRALRHYTDFKEEFDRLKSKLFLEKYYVDAILDNGLFTEVTLKDGEGKEIAALYFRFGLLKVVAPSTVDVNEVQPLFDTIWRLIFRNSIIATTTFKNGIIESKSYSFNQSDIETDVLGFTSSVISILDEMGNHNRTLFKMLEEAYKVSPRRKFLKLVRDDKFSTLSLYRSRLTHIRAGIEEFKELHKTRFNDKLIGIISNTNSEVEYLMCLLELTENFYEKKYASSLFVKQSGETRVALYSSVIACIVGVVACIVAIYSIPSVQNSNKQKEQETNKTQTIKPIGAVQLDSGLKKSNIKK